MNFPSMDVVERVRKQYPVGCRVRLEHMDDPYTKLVQGDTGTVQFVDAIASVHVAWDKGSSLAACYGEDRITRLDG